MTRLAMRPASVATLVATGCVGVLLTKLLRRHRPIAQVPRCCTHCRAPMIFARVSPRCLLH